MHGYTGPQVNSLSDGGSLDTPISLRLVGYIFIAFLDWFSTLVTLNRHWSTQQSVINYTHLYIYIYMFGSLYPHKYRSVTYNNGIFMPMLSLVSFYLLQSYQLL